MRLGAFNPFNLTFEYRASELPCEPCDVHFSISMDVEAEAATSQYIAIGFKEPYAAYRELSQAGTQLPSCQSRSSTQTLKEKQNIY